MGSFRRPRPRFMSSPVLSDLARFHANSPSAQLSNASVWNSVQSAVVKVFEGGGLQANELYTLNESIRWLLKTELGSFITDYLQNQLLTKGLSHILERVQLYEGERQLLILSEMWIRFFTETLPTLQAIFYPVQGQELSVRQMCLLAFRDLVLLKLPLRGSLSVSPCVPPAITQMLLILQGVHDTSGPSAEYYQLERLVEMVISPYVGKVLHSSALLLESHPSGGALSASSLVVRDPQSSRPEIRVTTSDSSHSLAPLVEQDGEAYLEKSGGVRRHTVANAHSDIRLLSASGQMMMQHTGGCAGAAAEEDSGSGGEEKVEGEGEDERGGVGMGGERTYYSQPDILEVPRCGGGGGGACQAAELG